MERLNLDDPGVFGALMEEIDARLSAQGIPIHHREFRVLSELASKVGPITWGSPLSGRVAAWIADHYGKKASPPVHIGRMLITIRQQAYVVIYPYVYGRYNLGLADLVTDAGPAALQGLPEADVKRLSEVLEQGFHAYHVFLQRKLSKHLIADLNAAVEHATTNPPALGPSKWASHHCVEVVLNGYLAAVGVKDVKREIKKAKGDPHLLVSRASLAESHGLPLVDRSLLAEIQCSVDARYGSARVSVEEAVRANQAAVSVCGHVAEHWPSHAAPNTTPEEMGSRLPQLSPYLVE